VRLKLAEREAALLRLESDEAEYLRRPDDVPRSSATPLDDIGEILPNLLELSSIPQTDPEKPVGLAPLQPSQDLSRFREINRNSLQSSFEIGQRIKINKAGRHVPDPSPDSEEPAVSLTPARTFRNSYQTEQTIVPNGQGYYPVPLSNRICNPAPPIAASSPQQLHHQVYTPRMQ
jgi:hypothetical protein